MTEAARGADRILDGLNSAQAAAVTHEAGPLLIIAGAGTGKTTVITRRIAHLIATRRARPSEILALTFTDKAAIEMEERVDTLVPYGYADVQISTFHAFGDHLIRENALELGLTPEFRVLTRAEQVIFLRAHLFELPLGHYRPLGDPTRHLQAIISHISRLKDEDVGPEEYLAHAEALLAAAADAETRLAAEEQLDLAHTYAQYQALMVRLGQVEALKHARENRCSLRIFTQTGSASATFERASSRSFPKRPVGARSSSRRRANWPRCTGRSQKSSGGSTTFPTRRRTKPGTAASSSSS
jgi:DNA helicase-2/ATP-dependent DNA helicase PcrA